MERGGLVKFRSFLKLNFYTFGSNLLKFAKTLALFGYFDFNDFYSTFDKFALPKHRLFFLAVCRIRISRKIYYIKPYYFCYSNFLKICKAVTNRPLKRPVCHVIACQPIPKSIITTTILCVFVAALHHQKRLLFFRKFTKEFYKFIARAGVTPTLLCFLLAPGSLRSRRALP